jgi:phage tail-like protein
VLQDEQHNDVLRWQFQNGWICKWEGATMNATSNDVAIESIEIVHERLELM